MSGGDVYGYVQETEVMLHLIMVPPKKSGTIVELDSGDFTVTEPAGRLRLDNGSEEDIKLMQRWPVRMARPYREKLPPGEPMISQRNIDSLSR